MRASEWIYEAAVRAAVPALWLASPFSERLGRGLRGRESALRSLSEWGAATRDATRPLLWLHAPSVGEALMAQAILAAARAYDSALQSIFTYFSPSAERIAPRIGADWHGYLPWDRVRDVKTALDAARPSHVAFVRTEIWPVLVREAARRGIGVTMVNGVLAPDSGRLGRGARILLGAAYRQLDAVGAVTQEDAECFARLGIDARRLHVTGDARFDQVWARVQGLDPDRPLLRPFRAPGRPWLVCGSTWPTDEDLLIAALRAHTWRAVIAPHEPTVEHLARLDRSLVSAGLRSVRLPDDAASHTDLDVDVVVVDRVGVLADLYAIGDAAYVGGGFGSAGLHSVVEPAALGVAVVYGPRHGNAREAARLHDARGGFIVSDGIQLDELMKRLFEDVELRRDAGVAARRFVAERLGGAAANAQLIRSVTRPQQRGRA